ncbi:hypothetical protein [Pseudorhodoferax aquiterrae]|nr:hypothetical protein [Pseudorhodoferax aquiterrae]
MNAPKIEIAETFVSHRIRWVDQAEGIGKALFDQAQQREVAC